MARRAARSRPVPPPPPEAADPVPRPAAEPELPPQVPPVAAAHLSSAQARRVLARARDLYERSREVTRARIRASDGVRESYDRLREDAVRAELDRLPVDRLAADLGRRFRPESLAEAGYPSVLRVLEAGRSELGRVPGIGARTAARLLEAARTVAEEVTAGLPVRVDLDPGNQRGTDLLQAIHHQQQVEQATAAVAVPAQNLVDALPEALDQAGVAGNGLRMLFTSAARRALVHAALVQLQRWTVWADDARIRRQLDEAARALARPGPDPDAVWRDFQRRAPEYYAVLEQVVTLRRDVAAAEGFLPVEIAERVRCQQLDQRYLRVRLRGYQEFGARFALAQRRVILGDEMGLGKTVQAVAALCHVRAVGGDRFCVVAPASVLVNWTREVAARSELVPHRLHGPGRDEAAATWLREGGVGVTTFESLRHVVPLLDGGGVDMLVVDEAHYVKNPATRRSRAVAAVCEQAERVLFLTGTPMENRVEEFAHLVDYLQPELVPALVDDGEGVAGPTTFRQSVAPVYLRRNQEDVLGELPELVQTNEWEEFSRSDLAAYQRAVLAGNFMAMRRAAFVGGDRRTSAKLGRLLEIVAEALENRRKVVVFSYFRDVLEVVLAALGPDAVGPLTGDIPATERQQLVDTFSARDGHAVLVSQILAGGVGLNMQAASVVILCEPQVKPTMETQAIARAHRMGQVRPVQVHRLLVADSVDQRMLEILDTKSQLFDEYARRSDLAEHSPEALDVSAAELARQVVALERERLAGDRAAAPANV